MIIRYIIQRLFYAIPTLVFISIISFIIIQLPPGDFVDYIMAEMANDASRLDADYEAQLRKELGADKPVYIQYLLWMQGVLVGDFGVSFMWNRPVNEIIWERLSYTLLIAFVSLIFTYLLAIPVGIYAATHQYSFGDYTLTFLGFIGVATPNFLLALVLIWIFHQYFGISIGGLFSPEFYDQPWSFAKFLDFISHLWVPIIVVGTAGTAWLIRIMRGTLMDELRQQYVMTARAKGVSERRLLYKYPVRMALVPIISVIGWQLPEMISATVITSVVLSLPTIGPIFLKALSGQDMFLAGSIVLILSSLTVVGNFVSDILLVIVDPRIHFESN